MKRIVVQLSNREVLRGLDLEVPHGVTALVGQNGAGKTTLLRVMTGVLRPHEGDVQRAGGRIFADSQAMVSHRKRLGWLPQEPGLPPRMSVDTLVSYAAWLKRIPNSQRVLAVDAALERVDLISLRRRRLGQLSGGQRRRAALAAALVGAPDLLLLDEPTNGLDPLQRGSFLAGIRAFAEHRSVIIATHLLEDVALVADHWCALEDGKISASGRIDRSSVARTAECIETVRAAVTTTSRI